jgi:tripartite-type tricarboxylate transporter receptor subunit TctC
MNRHQFLRKVGCGVFVAASLAWGWANAQTGAQSGAPSAPSVPTVGKPIKIVIGQAPGGAVDTVARLVGERLSIALGAPVVVESRAGAAGMIAADAVAKAPADGLTLGLLDVGALAVNPSLQPKIAYDISKDFAYLGGVAKIPLVLVAHPSAPVSTLPELTRYSRANPGRLSYASAGVGSPLHLAFEAYKQRMGVSVVHIPYRGGAPALADVAAGHVPLVFIDTNLASQYSKSGRVKPLAIATSERSAQLPDVPTFAEAGVPSFDFAPWVGLVAPAGLDATTQARLTAAVEAVAAQAEMQQQIRALGFMPWRMNGVQFASHVREEAVSYRGLIQARGIRLDQ